MRATNGNYPDVSVLRSVWASVQGSPVFMRRVEPSQFAREFRVLSVNRARYE
jgi:hypothetical protein